MPRRLLVPLVALLALGPPATPQARRQPPRLEPVAETKLLMEGLALSNFRGLERQLKERPREPETWVFARGQALLLAETANLLLMRPPRAGGQDAWFDRAVELREAATALARSAAARDFDRAPRQLVAVANACNRCHQTFRVPVQITPFEENK